MKDDTRKYIKFNDDVWNVINLVANGRKVRKQDALHMLCRIAIRTKQVQKILKDINVAPTYLRALAKLR